MFRAMRAHAAAFLAKHPELTFAALGAAQNASALDLRPFGISCQFLPAEKNGHIAAQFLAASELMLGKLAPPRWVLTDLYLLPAAVGLWRGPAHLLEADDRRRLKAQGDEPVVLAAYVATPTLVPSRFADVSLWSFLPGPEIGAWLKTLTLRMLGAARLRGVAQWSDPSIGVHTRLGPLQLVGRAPEGHALAAQSFVYECDLRDEARWTAAMSGKLSLKPTLRIEAIDTEALNLLVERAERGERVAIAPPGLDDTGHLLFVESPPLAAEGKTEGLVELDLDAQTVSALSPDDQAALGHRTAAIEKLLRSRYGKVELRKKRADLPWLQRLIDERAVTAADMRTIENAGAAFGDVVAHELGFHWVMVEDAEGRVPALRFRSTRIVLFPLVVFRRCADEPRVDVEHLYEAIERELLKLWAESRAGR